MNKKQSSILCIEIFLFIILCVWYFIVAIIMVIVFPRNKNEKRKRKLGKNKWREVGKRIGGGKEPVLVVFL